LLEAPRFFIVAPSDMMDGRIGAIRKALEENGFIHTSIKDCTPKFSKLFTSFFNKFK
jgi:porphobilinogen synthase